MNNSKIKPPTPEFSGKSESFPIAVLGCGWLGFPLAKRLIAGGHSVKGSVTSFEKLAKLRNEGIIPFQVKILSQGVQGDLSSFLSGTKILIINLPPGLRRDTGQNFSGKMAQVKEFIEEFSIEKVLFVSSTSVYHDAENFPEYSEKHRPNGTSEAARQLFEAEELLQSEHFKTTILRFGGLIGPDRHPVNYLAGKTGIKNPKAPVNLIHQQDCIEIILQIINKNAWGEIFNAVFPEHPDKESYYSAKAGEKNLPLPQFNKDHPSEGKIIHSENLRKSLNFRFSKSI